MAWIEYHTILRDHWKVSRLATILGVEYTTALGAVSCLWLWAAECASDGNISRFSDDEIRNAMRCDPKNAPRFSKKCTLEALKSSLLVDKSGKIHDWGKHGIKLLKSSRKRQKEYREKLRNGNVTVTSFSLSLFLTSLSIKYTHLKDKVFLETIEEFLKMRKAIRKPATERAIELILKDLQKEELIVAVKMLEQSIINSWQGIFPLKNIQPFVVAAEGFHKP